MSDLVLRALRYYNVGEGLTRAEIVDMARRLDALEEIRQRVADGWMANSFGQSWLRDGEVDPITPEVAAVLWPEDTSS